MKNLSHLRRQFYAQNRLITIEPVLLTQDSPFNKLMDLADLKTENISIVFVVAVRCPDDENKFQSLSLDEQREKETEFLNLILSGKARKRKFLAIHGKSDMKRNMRISVTGAETFSEHFIDEVMNDVITNVCENFRKFFLFNPELPYSNAKLIAPVEQKALERVP